MMESTEFFTAIMSQNLDDYHKMIATIYFDCVIKVDEAFVGLH